MKRWLPENGFTLGQPTDDYDAWGRLYTEGYDVRSAWGWEKNYRGYQHDIAAVQYRAQRGRSAHEEERLKAVAEAVEVLGIEYDWAYLGDYKRLSLVIRACDLYNEQQAPAKKFTFSYMDSQRVKTEGDD